MLFTVLVLHFSLAQAQIPVFIDDLASGDYYDMAIADFDQDGDKDVFAVVFGLDRIDYFENTGLDLGPGVTFDNTVDNAICLATGDLDNNGWLDLICGSRDDDRVLWWANSPSGFGPPSEISTSANSPLRVAADDLDGDGDIDVAAALSAGDQIAWFENVSAGSSWIKHVVGGPDGPNDVVIADLNGDTKPDLLTSSAGDGHFSWYTNLGSGVFSGEQVLTTAYSNPFGVAAADFDGDGRMDLACQTNGNTLFWMQADSTQGSIGWQAPVVVSTDISAGRRIAAGDINLDGLPDLVGASKDDGTYAWYPSLGGSWGAREVISDAYPAAYYVRLNDFDGDGDLDLFGGSTNALGTGELTYFENGFLTNCPTPDNAVMVPGIGSASATWDAVYQHNGYRIRGVRIATGETRNLFTVTTATPSLPLAPGEDYAWVLQARCTDGSISAATSPDTFTTLVLRTAEAEQVIRAWPVPMTTALHIDGLNRVSDSPVVITDMMGRSQPLVCTTGTPVVCDVSELPRGRYELYIGEDRFPLLKIE
jgi:hypothetical protein